jgi:hypothetical protein
MLIFITKLLLQTKPEESKTIVAFSVRFLRNPVSTSTFTHPKTPLGLHRQSRPSNSKALLQTSCNSHDLELETYSNPLQEVLIHTDSRSLLDTQLCHHCSGEQPNFPRFRTTSSDAERGTRDFLLDPNFKSHLLL